MKSNIDKRSILGGLLVGIPIGGEIQNALISGLYKVIGFGLPADVPGAALAVSGLLSMGAGAAILLTRKPVT